MAVTVTVKQRIPMKVYERLAAESRACGLPITDLLNEVVAEKVGEDPPPKTRLLRKLSNWTKMTYAGNFPSDVTLHVCKHLVSTPTLMKLYEAALQDDYGKEKLHQDIGVMVKLALNAKKVGQSNPVDPAKYLITTHALLAPQ